MLALLRALAARRTPVALHFGKGDTAFHTELIGINPAFEELLFAPGRDRDTLGQLLEAGSFGVETAHDSVRILFIATHAEITQFKHEGALRARIPDTLARMQRREALRVAIPKDKPSFCTLHGHAQRNAKQSANPADTRLRVIDVSIRGLGLSLSDPNPAITPGKTLADCSLELPGIGVMRCALRVVHMKEAGTDGREQRIGCGFIDLPGLSREQIRSYVTRLERAQLALG